MGSTITARVQTVVPAPIRERFGLGPSTRLEWIVDGDGTVRVVPVALDPIQAFRGSGAGGSSARRLGDRAQDRQREERCQPAGCSTPLPCLHCGMTRTARNGWLAC